MNDAKPEYVIARVKDHADRLKAPRIAVLGLAFKPDIDDLRESPALTIATRIAAEIENSAIYVVEPHVQELPVSLAELRNVELRELNSAVSDADIVLILVDHTGFKQVDRKPLRLREKVVIDTKGIWN